MSIGFIIVILSGAIGFWLGLRSQREEIVKDIKKTTKKIGGVVRAVKKVDKSGIIKAMTPEEFEEERRQKFEKENY